MNEVKKPKKSIISYYLIVLLVMMLFNWLVMPWILQRQIQQVDYGTFMTMTEEGHIGQVDIQSNQIVFTDKENTKIYKTGLMDDPGRTERLHAAGAVFSSEIIEEASPLISILLSWVLPMVLFIFLGQFMTKKLMDRAGGGAGAMSFNMGKSNAKVYVKSSDGIKFSDVAGEDEAKENLTEIVAITWKQVLDGGVYTFSEIKIAHPSQFRRFLSGGEFGSDKLYVTTQMAQSVNAVVASSGDFYGYRQAGTLVYDGVVRRVNNGLVDTR